MKKKRMTRNRWIGLGLFILYIVLLLYLMFFADLAERGVMAKAEYTYNLRPFVEIRRYLLNAQQIGLKGVLLNLWGNVFGFMPLGFVLPTFSRRCRRYWYNTVFAAYLLSWLIEMAQLFLRAGSCDVDDILLNTLGGFCGYICFHLTQRLRSRRYRQQHGF